ncbi:MAG: TIGR00296 family protein [Thermoprotei archaeon]
MDLSDEDGKLLVALARRAVEEYLVSNMTYKLVPPKDTPKHLWEKGGVFVTINGRSARGSYDELRGCIGFPYPILPVVQATIEAAIAAATEDPRFYPLGIEELEGVTFEVSVLSSPRELTVPKDQLPLHIRVGRDGLIVQRYTKSGLLLPQVAVEYGWDSEQFLKEACVKAGLEPDAWKDERTKVLSFTATVFAEEQPLGRVVRRPL